MSPKNRHASLVDSLIVLGGTRIQIIGNATGTSSVKVGRVSVRTTEVMAEASCQMRTLSTLDMELLYLERVASQPSLYPEVKDKPLRPISGYHLCLWLGKRLGLGVEQVKARLEEISELLAENARAVDW